MQQMTQFVARHPVIQEGGFGLALIDIQVYRITAVARYLAPGHRLPTDAERDDQ